MRKLTENEKEVMSWIVLTSLTTIFLLIVYGIYLMETEEAEKEREAEENILSGSPTFSGNITNIYTDSDIFIPDYIVVTLDTKDHFVMAVTSDDMENIPSMMVGQKYNFWLKLKTEKTNFFDTTDYYGLPIYESLKIEGDSL